METLDVSAIMLALIGMVSGWVTTVTNRDRISTQARHASGTRHVSGDRNLAPLPVPGDRNLAPTWLAALKWFVELVVALGALVLIVKMKRV